MTDPASFGTARRTLSDADLSQLASDVEAKTLAAQMHVEAESQAELTTEESLDPYAHVSTEDKIEIIRAQMVWLCQHVQMLLTIASANPMFRAAMAKAVKDAAKLKGSNHV